MCDALIAPHIATGDLFAARRAALDFSRSPPALPSTVSLPFAAAPPAPPSNLLDKAAATACEAAWSARIDELLARPNALEAVASAHRTHSHTHHAIAFARCDADNDNLDWPSCCSLLPAAPARDCGDAPAACCAIGSGSSAALRLPMLRDPSLVIRLRTGRLVSVEQDGFLRPFDVATVLWPAGYLLAQWAGDEANHHLWLRRAHRPFASEGAAATDVARVLELGTGTGLAAIAAALSSYGRAAVTATDVALRSLALATANAALNGADAVRTLRLDWGSDDSLTAAAAEASGGYDLVLGGALQFETWSERLWSVLRTLVRPPPALQINCSTAAMDRGDGSRGGEGSEGDEGGEGGEGVSRGGGRGGLGGGRGGLGGGLVALAHTTGALPSPPMGSGWAEIARVPGLAYGLRTRWSASESDFEVVLLRRVPSCARSCEVSVGLGVAEGVGVEAGGAPHEGDACAA